jgi:hypothetical protein
MLVAGHSRATVTSRAAMPAATRGRAKEERVHLLGVAPTTELESRADGICKGKS